MTDINELFYRNVVFHCRSRRLKIGYIEMEAGLNQGDLSRFSGGGRKMPLAVAARLAKLLGVTVDDLISVDLAKERRIQLLEQELEQLKQGRQEDGLPHQ